MNRLDEVILKGRELNDAINRLNEETKTLKSITEEKRTIKREQILNDLNKYVEIMEQLNIDTVDFSTKTCMFYSRLTRLMGIKLHIWEYRRQKVVQIDLGVYSTVADEFYAKHSMGTVLSGVKNESILNGFCENWDRIKNMIDETFVNEVEKILQERKEKAINEREKAIRDLTDLA